MMNYELIKRNRLFVIILLLILILGFILRINLVFFNDAKYFFSVDTLKDFFSAGYEDPYQFNKNLFALIKKNLSGEVSISYILLNNLTMRLASNVYALKLISLLPNLLSLIVSIFFTKKLCDLFSTEVGLTKNLILFVIVIHSFMFNNIIHAIKVAPDSMCYLLMISVYILILGYIKKPSYSSAIAILILVLISASFEALLSLTLLPLLLFFIFDSTKNEDHKKEKFLFSCSIPPLIWMIFKTHPNISFDKFGNNFIDLFQEFFSSPLNISSLSYIISIIFLLLYLYGVISFLIERKFALFSISFLPMLSLIFDSSNLLMPRFFLSVLIGIFFVFTKLTKEKNLFPSTVLLSITVILFLLNHGFFTIPANYNYNFLKIIKSQYKIDLQRNSKILNFLHYDINNNDLILIEEDLRKTFFHSVPLMRLNTTLLCKNNEECLKKNKALDLASLKNKFCIYKIDDSSNFLNECVSPQENKNLVIVSKDPKDESLLINLLSSKNNYKLNSKSYLKDWYHLKFSK